MTGVNYVDGADDLHGRGPHRPGDRPGEHRAAHRQPRLTDTAVGRRDIRAIPGPLAPDHNGYQSSLGRRRDVHGDLRVHRPGRCAHRGHRWRRAPAVLAVHRRGRQPAGHHDRRVRRARWSRNGRLPERAAGSGPRPVGRDGGQRDDRRQRGIRVNWTPAVAIPGTPAITGYRVTAVAQTSPAASRSRSAGGSPVKRPTAPRSPASQADETYDVRGLRQLHRRDVPGGARDPGNRHH